MTTIRQVIVKSYHSEVLRLRYRSQHIIFGIYAGTSSFKKVTNAIGFEDKVIPLKIITEMAIRATNQRVELGIMFVNLPNLTMGVNQL